MGRSLLVGTLLLVACTRANPAFDPDASGSDEVVGDDESSDVGDATESSEQGESASETETESGASDLPNPACEHQPSAGLNLKFGDPAVLGTCPVAIDVWARVVESGGTWVVENCNDGCETCTATYPLSAYPMNLDGHVPGELNSCLRIQASVPLGQGPEACHWGALSIFDGVDFTPYVIAIANGSEPTSLGLQTVGDSIPEPVKVATCSCDEVDQGHDCCYQSPTPPEFFAYPWDGEFLLPGDFGSISITNPHGLDYVFEVYQAERLNACDAPERSLSWAVSAKLR
jgi:hypothetical protein